MQLHLKITGFVLVILALIHIIFPKYFDWKKDLGALSLINKQMMYIHTFFIALAVFLMGLLCITSAPALIATSLGHKVLLGLAVFWMCRFVIQFAGYSSKLWRGRKFETIIHIVFSILWLYISSVFLCAYWLKGG